jgi:hypothetical protein
LITRPKQIIKTYLKEICHFVVSVNNESVDFGFNLLTLAISGRNVPPAQAGLPLSILEQYELYLLLTVVISLFTAKRITLTIISLYMLDYVF